MTGIIAGQACKPKKAIKHGTKSSSTHQTFNNVISAPDNPPSIICFICTFD